MKNINVLIYLHKVSESKHDSTTKFIYYIECIYKIEYKICYIIYIYIVTQFIYKILKEINY